jgi:hypothetical protein
MHFSSGTDFAMKHKKQDRLAEGAVCVCAVGGGLPRSFGPAKAHLNEAVAHQVDG